MIAQVVVTVEDCIDEVEAPTGDLSVQVAALKELAGILHDASRVRAFTGDNLV